MGNMNPIEKNGMKLGSGEMFEWTGGSQVLF